MWMLTTLLQNCNILVVVVTCLECHQSFTKTLVYMYYQFQPKSYVLKWFPFGCWQWQSEFPVLKCMQNQITTTQNPMLVQAVHNFEVTTYKILIFNFTLHTSTRNYNDFYQKQHHGTCCPYVKLLKKSFQWWKQLRFCEWTVLVQYRLDWESLQTF